MKFDTNVLALILAAFGEEKDVFLSLLSLKGVNYEFTDVRTLVLFPTAFAGKREVYFSDIREGVPYAALNTVKNTVYADVRFLSDTSFREFLKASDIRRIVIPFAECIMQGEWKYREAFQWITEFRAECPYFCQVVAFLPSVDTNVGEYAVFFGSKGAVFVGEKEMPVMKVFETSFSGDKFSYVTKLSEKYAYKKVCIFFNSRNEAEFYGRMLVKRNIPYLYINGGLCTSVKRNLLERFQNCEINILLATASLISDTAFFYADVVIFAGVPLSLSMAVRCADLSCKNELNVVFCPDDVIRNEKISSSLADVSGIKEIGEKRHEYLCDMIKILEKEKLK